LIQFDRFLLGKRRIGVENGAAIFKVTMSLAAGTLGIQGAPEKMHSHTSQVLHDNGFYICDRKFSQKKNNLYFLKIRPSVEELSF
jgi:hypothetical protein